MYNNKSIYFLKINERLCSKSLKSNNIKLDCETLSMKSKDYR